MILRGHPGSLWGGEPHDPNSWWHRWAPGDLIPICQGMVERQWVGAWRKTPPKGAQLCPWCEERTPKKVRG